MKKTIAETYSTANPLTLVVLGSKMTTKMLDRFLHENFSLVFGVLSHIEDNVQSTPIPILSKDKIFGD